MAMRASNELQEQLSLRVITFNIKNGGVGREHYIFEVFKMTQPNLILLQEVTQPNLVHELANTLHMEFAVAKGNSYRRVAILSRFPIRSCVSRTACPGLSRDSLAAVIEHPAHPFAVFVVHLIAQPFVAFEGLRLLEIWSVLRHAAQYLSLPCLLAGDFNAVSPTDQPLITESMPWPVRLMLLLQGSQFPRAVISTVEAAQFVDCFRLLHTEPGYTLPPPAPTIRFDYLFANAHLKPFLQSCVVLRQSSAVEHASDHYPLLADFAL